MAAKTRLQARTELNRRLGSRSGSEFSNADLDAWLNDGLLDVATRRIHLRSLERVGSPIVSTPAVAAYPIPTGAFSLLYLEDTTNSKVLTRFVGTFEEYLKAKQSESPDTTTIPYQFIEYGSNFYVSQTPQVNTINWTPYYYARPTWAGGDSAAPDIEEEFHKAVIILASRWAFKDIGDEERAQLADGEFQSWLAQRDTPRRMTQRFNVPTRGIRPHGQLRNSRTGV